LKANQFIRAHLKEEISAEAEERVVKFEERIRNRENLTTDQLLNIHEAAATGVYTSASSYDSAGGGTIPVSKIRAPGVAALPAALMISRALRPFARRVESKYFETLDVSAIVQLSAEISSKERPVILPVMKPAKE
jgi:hypothetical protein